MRWQLVSQQVMLAPILQQMKQLWKEHSNPLCVRTWALRPVCISRQGVGCGQCQLRSPKAPAGEQEELPKPLVVQSSLLLPGAPHLLGCFSDDVLGVLKEELSSVLLWEKPSGEELQSRGGQELVRSGRQGCAGQKAGGSHKTSHLAVGVDTELDRHSLVATDVGVRLGPVAEHARW